jgi:NAD(P)-dependent dehydrogenase (short-subunit alcohol dehydrogenase family)
MNQLKSKRILVVGGSSGIGAATASAFAELGADVLIVSRNAAKLAETAAGIGNSVSTAVLDTTNAEAVEAFFATAGNFDHVVISAAQTPSGPIRELALAADGGSLTLVSGFLSVRPSKTSVLQGAINAALEALARGLALELSPVRVNTVSPGLIATPLWSKLSEDARQTMYEGAAARLPARRVGQPEDVANAVVYLASTPYATGSTVLVDGGGAIV